MKLSKALAGLSVAVLVALVLLPVVRGLRGRRGEQTAPLILYCAAGVKPPVQELVTAYEREYGQPISLQFGGSGTLLSNIQVARRGDLYLAADASYIELARKKGLVAEAIEVAHMRPVIVVTKGNPRSISALRDLLRPELRVALGNPDAASIGKQAKAILAEHGLWTEMEQCVTDRGVFKPTVPELANDVKLGAVDAAIVWDATVRQYTGLQAVEVPEFEKYSRAITIGVLKASSRPTEALRFARYVSSNVGNAVFEKCGYEAAGGDDWAWNPEITFFCGAVNRRAVAGVVEAFEEREGVRVNTVYNGCGILTGQMRTIRDQQGERGFPDAYMACDRYYLENVKAWFESGVDVSEAAIVIAVPKGNPKGIADLADLAAPGMRVAVGQPRQCTIGALTRILLERENLYAAVMTNVVVQAASSAMLVPTVVTKSVDAAIAYVTDTRAEGDKVDVVRITSPAARAVQPFSIAQSSRHKQAGRRLFEAIKRARADFEQAGFDFLLTNGVQEARE